VSPALWISRENAALRLRAPPEKPTFV